MVLLRLSRQPRLAHGGLAASAQRPSGQGVSPARHQNRGPTTFEHHGFDAGAPHPSIWRSGRCRTTSPPLDKITEVPFQSTNAMLSARLQQLVGDHGAVPHGADRLTRFIRRFLWARRNRALFQLPRPRVRRVPGNGHFGIAPTLAAHRSRLQRPGESFAIRRSHVWLLFYRMVLDRGPRATLCMNAAVCSAGAVLRFR